MNIFEQDKILRLTIKTMLNMIYIDSEILVYGYQNNDDAFQGIGILNGMSMTDLFHKEADSINEYLNKLI